MEEFEKINIEPSIYTFNKLTKIADDLLGVNNINTILEFGSRYGEDSIAFAKRYPKATVFAFECNPNTLVACKKNINDYKNIILTEKAVSNIDGSVSFFKIDKDKTETTWLDGNQGASSLLKASGKYPIEKYVQEEIKVESIMLSTFISKNRLNYIDILWMDIQGAELFALKGLKSDIEKVKIIHIEVEFFEIYKDQVLFDEIAEFLNSNGFEMLGFSSLGEYAGDAIFINKKFASEKKIKSLKKYLSPKLANSLKNLYLLSKHFIFQSITYIIKKNIFKYFKHLSILFLKAIKKIRKFDKSFPIYFPSIYNTRDILLWKTMVLNPLLNLDVNFKKNNISKIPIDIFIPASVKDTKVLGNVIKNALINIQHPINKVFVIAAECNEIIEICNEFGAVFINENDVLSYNKNSINYLVNNIDRSGWLFQQLLKLNADTIVEMENFLILDADTSFVRPKTFIYKRKTILDLSQERHEPYHVVYEKILNRKTTSELSFITHYMLFNKHLLKLLKFEIESIHHKDWDKAILEKVDYNSQSGFSEYELYGNFVSEKYPKLIKKEYWFNSTLHSTVNPNYIKSISLHSYIKDTFHY